MVDGRIESRLPAVDPVDFEPRPQHRVVAGVGDAFARPPIRALAEAGERLEVAVVAGHLVEVEEPEEERRPGPVGDAVFRRMGELPVGDALHRPEDFARRRIGGGQRVETG